LIYPTISSNNMKSCAIIGNFRLSIKMNPMITVLIA